MELELCRGVLIFRDDVLDTMEGKSVMTVDMHSRVSEAMVYLETVRQGVACVTRGLEPGNRIIVVGERLVSDGEVVRVLREHPPVEWPPAGTTTGKNPATAPVGGERQPTG